MKKALCLMLSVLLLFSTLEAVFAAEYPEVSITAEKNLLTSADMTSDGMYVFRLSAVITGVENTEDLKYSWSYREKGVTAWWRKCPDAAVRGNTLVMPISPDTINVYKGIEFICNVFGESLEPVASETRCVCAAPFFTSDLPESIKVREDELNGEVFTVRAQAAAAGLGELEYAWEMSTDDGESWTVCGENSPAVELTLPNACFTQGTTLLRCYVTDENGNTTVSANTRLGVIYAPVITADLPESYVYKAGEFSSSGQLFSGHTFSISAVGEDLVYEWYSSFDGGESWTKADCAQADFSPEISIKDFCRSYSVLIKASVISADGIRTDSGICRCTFAPLITSDLPSAVYVDADDIVTVGGTDYFRLNASAAAEGCTELTYKWYYSDLSLLSENPYRELAANGASVLENALIPKEAVLWTSHIYCEAVDKNGDTAATSSAKVIYIHKPEITLPESVKITGNDIVDGACECNITAKGVSREKAPISYKWYERFGDSEWFEVEGGTAKFTRRYSVSELLSGISVKCEATVHSSFTTVSDECGIVLSPCFTEQPRASAVEYGETGTITAKAVATGEVTYKWLRSTDNYRWFEIGDNSIYSGSDTDTLTVDSVTETVYNTYYRCRAVAGDDLVYSKQTRFAKPAIKITSEPTDTPAAVGKAAVFSVQAEGVGLTYKWSCCGYLSTSWKNAVSNSDIEVFNAGTAALTVNVKTEAAYNYMFRCTVSDGEKTVYSGSVRIIQSEDGGVEPIVPRVILRGDADLNGKVDAADARLALRAAVGLENYKNDSDNFLAADWNSNGKITADDARSILRKSVGLKVE